MVTTTKISALPSVTGLQVNDVLVLNRGGAFSKGATFTQIQDTSGNALLTLTKVASAVNQINLSNNSTGNAPILTAVGTDSNIGFNLTTKGTGVFTLSSANTTSPLTLLSGTGLQHSATFAFSNAATTNTYTFQEGSQTIAGSTVPLYGTGVQSFTAYAPILGGTTSTGALQSTASGNTGQILQSNGSAAKPTWSTPTYPSASPSSGKILQSDGTNIVASSTTWPNASATTRKITVSDGTNWVASTETWAIPGSQYNMLQSDGTNWAAVASTGTGTPVLQTSPTLITPKIGSLCDTSGNTVIGLTNQGGTSVNYLQVGCAPTGAAVNIQTLGSDSNVNLNFNAKGTGSIQFVNAGANSLLFSPATTGNAPSVASTGSDSNVGLTVQPKGTGAFTVLDGNGNKLINTSTSASAVNYITIFNNTTGSGPIIYANGSDTNVNWLLWAKNAGYLQFNSNTAVNSFIMQPTVTGTDPNFYISGDANRNLLLQGAGTGGAWSKGQTGASTVTAGYMGELQSSIVTAVAISNSTVTQVTSLSLTAGNWIVYGNIYTVPASTTTQSYIKGAIDATTATITANRSAQIAASVAATDPVGLTVPCMNVNISGTTIYYLNAYVAYATSTLTIDGQLFARRVS